MDIRYVTIERAGRIRFFFRGRRITGRLGELNINFVGGSPNYNIIEKMDWMLDQLDSIEFQSSVHLLTLSEKGGNKL